MKLPLDFGLKLFFRLLLPGFFLTLGLLPLYFGILDLVGLSGQKEVAFVLAVIVTGWLIVAADMPVYMLLEGRRFWPGALWSRMLRGEERRLGRVLAAIEEHFDPAVARTPTVERRYIEAGVDRRSFPLNERGEPTVNLPTRLGNTIAAFETYSDSRYGLEAIFYWPRIWVNLPKELREEIDNQQAMADSAVYSTFALGMGGIAWLMYGVLEAGLAYAGRVLDRLGIERRLFGEGIFDFTPPFMACVLIAGVFLSLACVVYRVAIFSNEQYGNVFMAAIDSHVGKVRKEYVDVEAISRHVGSLTEQKIPEAEKLEVARRYLQYFNATIPGVTRTVPIPQVGDTLAKKQRGESEQVTGSSNSLPNKEAPPE